MLKDRRLLVAGLLLGLTSCAPLWRGGSLPLDPEVIQGPFVFHGDFHSPERRALAGRLRQLQEEIVTNLDLGDFSEPVFIHILDSRADYDAFLVRKFDQLQGRRAVFVANATGLSVYTFWGDRVEEDLRHEATHACLHATMPQVPLWLDEGLAEYYEDADTASLHQQHLELLQQGHGDGTWQPNLIRLESLPGEATLRQIDYAESWLWVHFLLQDEAGRDLLLAYLQSLQRAAPTERLQPQLARAGISTVQLERHLNHLSQLMMRRAHETEVLHIPAVAP